MPLYRVTAKGQPDKIEREGWARLVRGDDGEHFMLIPEGSSTGSEKLWAVSAYDLYLYREDVEEWQLLDPLADRS